MSLKFPKELVIGGTEWSYTPFRFDVHAINTGSYTPSYRDVTVTGVSPLNLPNAEANGLRNIKLFGKCEQTPNLFDKDKATLNYFINASGEEQYNASWACSDYIEVTAGKPYNLSGVTSYGTSPRTGFYAADKSFVSARSQSSANFTIPDGVKYMRMSIYKTSVNTAVIKQVLTFDKYTIVGSPTFNGYIVSGFSSSNYLNIIQLSQLANKSWTIKGSFSYADGGGCLLGLTGTWAVRGAISYGNTGNVTFYAYCGTTGDTTAEGAKITLSSILTTKGAIYTYELSFNYTTGEYSLSVYDSNNTLIGAGTYTPPTTNKQLFSINNSPTTFITIGKPLSGTGATAGTIDLKSYKITVDGVTTTIVGNKIPILCNNGEVGSTGYTKIGNPTISSDLVVSDFSANDCLNIGNYFSYTNLNGHDWKIECEFTYNAVDTSTTQAIMQIFNSLAHNSIRLYNNQIWCSLRTTAYTEKTLSPVLVNGKTYKVTLECDKSTKKYTLSLYQDNALLSSVDTFTAGDLTFGEYDLNNFYIGRGISNTSWYLRSSVDLKKFNIIVDGVPVRLLELISLNGQTAVAQDLLSCGDDYTDVQNVTTGEITRKVGVHIFDGTENWRKSASQPSSGIRFQANTGLTNRAYGANLLGLCTHFKTVASSAIQQDINTFVYSTFNEYIFVIVDSNNFPTVDDWTSYVASLYAQGKPIIITYPLATPTTETVPAQNTLQTIEGLNTVTIIQAAIEDLFMEVTYSAGVEVTIQTVQNANVDQQVEVIIGE